jgi:F0F1-type ATP synthase assembly protein I
MEINESLETEVALCDADISLCDEQLENEKNKVKILTEINEEKEAQTEILTSENKKQKKKMKLLKKTRTLFTIGGTIIGGVVGYLITK